MKNTTKRIFFKLYIIQTFYMNTVKYYFLIKIIEIIELTNNIKVYIFNYKVIYKIF